MIPAQYRLLAAGLAVAVLMALAAAGAWQWQANAYGRQLAERDLLHANTLAELARASARMLQAQQDKRQVLEQRLATLDSTEHQDLTDGQAENDRLRRLYADADDERRRLRIEVRVARADAAVSATTGASRVGDGESVELSGAAGQTVWDIRAGIIADRSKLTYWQGRACAIQPSLVGCQSSR